MARAPTGRGHPIDEPVLLRPGVMHREADFHGAASHYALPPEHAERADKGDLGLEKIPGFDSRASFESPGEPFASLSKTVAPAMGADGAHIAAKHTPFRSGLPASARKER